MHTPHTRLYGCHSVAMDEQVNDYLKRDIIIPCCHEEGEFVSTVFLREKKNNTFRMILNLKELNQFTPYHHFKMDSIYHCIRLMKPLCYMASIDLQDAYFSIPIHEDHQKYLKFLWKGILYKFICMSQGIACAPRLFTKLMKPVYSSLRSKGLVSSGYLDDSFLEGDTKDSCLNNVQETYSLLNNLGFSPNDEKSVTVPTQIIEHLGFVLNSIDMTVTLTDDKMLKLHKIAMGVLTKEHPTIREVARLIGFLVSCTPGVQYAELFYKQLETDKAITLRASNGNFDSSMSLSSIAISDIHWWLENATKCKRKINQVAIDMTLSTDASKLGWGASALDQVTGGRWSPAESGQHINVLELKAVLRGLQSLCKAKQDCHIKILSDNTTTVSYLKNMGGTHSLACNEIARKVWLWCISRKIYLTAAHIPGKTNIQADQASRLFNDRTEWQLDKSVFKKLLAIFGKPEVDMFASRLNHQLPLYVAWIPDPEAMAVDAFTQNWTEHYIYIFPSFSVIPQVLQKIEQDQAQAIMVAPLWPTQSWLPKLTKLLIQEPVLLPQEPQLLTLPHQPEKTHPLREKLVLMACRLSGQASLADAFQNRLKKSYSNHGARELKNSMKPICKSGYPFVVNDILIPCNQL